MSYVTRGFIFGEKTELVVDAIAEATFSPITNLDNYRPVDYYSLVAEIEGIVNEVLEEDLVAHYGGREEGM